MSFSPARIVLVALSPAASLFVAACDAPAQASGSTVTISRVSCIDCRLELQQLTTLGGADAPTPHPWYRVWRDRHKRFYVAPLYRRTAEIAVFDSLGRQLHIIGRDGEGPGEFSFVRAAIPGPGDSLFVFDIGNVRVSVLSPSYEYVRSYPLVGRSWEDALVLDSSRVLLQASLRSPERAGYPLHLLDADGSITRSFGSEEPVVDRRSPLDGLRLIAGATTGSVWSGMLNEYELEKWDLQGRRLLTIRREADWFRSWRQQNAQPEDMVRPLPRLHGLHQDDTGRLWSFVWVAESNWSPRRSSGQSKAGVEHTPVPPTELDRFKDTIVEIFDPRKREVVASQRFNELLRPLADDLVYSDVEDAQGNQLIAIWRLRLLEPGKEGK